MTEPNRFRFRAWDKEDLRMFEPNGLLNPVDDLGKERYIHMQSTGLADSKYIEIFAGDIVKWQHPRYDKEPRTACVEYNSMFGAFTIKGDYFCSLDIAIDTLEVIGNIYENPDLILKKSND